MSSSFDQFYSDMQTGADRSPIKPLYACNYKDEEKLHKWIKETFQSLMNEHEDRIREVSENHRLYKGEISNSSLNGTRGDGFQSTNTFIKDEELFVNYMKQLTDEQVNKITEVKPAVDVLPVHDEHDDKVGAKISKSIIDTRFYEGNFDKTVRQLTRRTKIAGEDYIHIFWNKDKGAVHPSVQGDKKVPLLGEDGKPEKDDDGKIIYIDKDLKIGEVDWELVDTRHVLPEPSDDYKDANWVIRLKREYVHDLRLEYPDKAGKIKAMKADGTSINGMTETHLRSMEMRDQTLVLCLYHKKHKNLKNGYFAKATMDCVLEQGDFPYNMEGLPFVKRSDKEIEGEAHAQSFMHDVKALQALEIDMTSMMMQNLKLCSYPKWFVDQGSVSTQSLGSGRTVVSVRQGSRRPELSAPPTIPSDLFNFREDNRNQMRLLSTGGMNEPGQPPKGITAGVALQYLNEEENKRYNTDIAGHFDMIKESAEMILSLAHQYYDEDDGRFLRVLGKNNEHTAISFKKIDPNKPYDIRLSHTTGLPETKSAKVQTVIDLATQFEGLFSKEQIIDLLELGNSNKMYDQATAAVKSAESTLEDLLQGNPVMEAQAYENLIVSWKVFTADIQKRSFKENVPENIRQAVLDYIGTMEMLMIEKANINTMFAQEMAQLSLFPCVFNMPPAPTVDPAMMDGTEGAPGTQPMIDPATSAGSEAALPQEEQMGLKKRSDANF